MTLTILFFANFLLSQIYATNGNNSFANVNLMFVLLGFCFLAPLGVPFFAWGRRDRREKLFRNFAIQNGWGYYAWNDVAWNERAFIFNDRNKYRLFSLGYGMSGMVYNLAYRPFENGKISVFDYYYDKVKGKFDVEGKATVVCFEFANYQLPQFALYPEGFWSEVGEFFGTKDIDFPTHPNFSSRYKLNGADETQIRQLFHPKVLNYLENMPVMHIDGFGTQIFIYTKDYLAPIESLDQFIYEKVNIFNALRQPR